MSSDLEQLETLLDWLGTNLDQSGQSGQIVLTKTHIWTKNLIVERTALCLSVPFDFKFPFWAGGEEKCGKFFSSGNIEGVDEHFFYAPVSVKSF